MVSIIYPYRNRERQRLKRSFDSLLNQTNKNFEVYFVDYGTNLDIASEIKTLCLNYSFIKYQSYQTQFQPWNKSRALNSVIKKITSNFCFVADVDIIFHPDFIKIATELQQPETSVYFQVGFLKPDNREVNKSFVNYKDYRKSTSEATGLSMLPVEILQKLRGFDEFYHFWGAEDTDMHVRLRNAGYKVNFYDDKVLLLHQWHASYRGKETNKLSEDFQINGIVQLNHQHLKFAIENKLKVANTKEWGEIMSKSDKVTIEDTPVTLIIKNEKRQVDDFLYGQMPRVKDEILKVIIELDPFQNSLKYLSKRLLNKKVPLYYSLKEVNDMVLLHLISFYRDKPYTYKVESEANRIILGIQL